MLCGEKGSQKVNNFPQVRSWGLQFMQRIALSYEMVRYPIVSSLVLLVSALVVDLLTTSQPTYLPLSRLVFPLVFLLALVKSCCLHLILSDCLPICLLSSCLRVVARPCPGSGLVMAGPPTCLALARSDLHLSPHLFSHLSPRVVSLLAVAGWFVAPLASLLLEPRHNVCLHCSLQDAAAGEEVNRAVDSLSSVNSWTDGKAHMAQTRLAEAVRSWLLGEEKEQERWGQRRPIKRQWLHHVQKHLS